MGCVPAGKCCYAWKMSLLCHSSELASAEAVRLPGLLAGVWGAEHEAETQAVHTSRVHCLWKKKKKNTSMSWISHFHLKEDGREKSVS